MKEENVILGIAGSMVGTIPGIILYIILAQMNFYASIAALAIIYGSIYSYRYMAKIGVKDELQDGRKSGFYVDESISIFGTAVSILASIAGVFIAETGDMIIRFRKDFPQASLGESLIPAITAVFEFTLLYFIISIILVIIGGISFYMRNRSS